MNKRKIFLPVLILAVGVGGFMTLKATRPKPPLVQAKEPVWRVQAMPARVERLSPMLKLNGRVESPDQNQAAAPGMGRVLRVWVREGQAVSKGQLLLELDPRDFQPQVDQARGQVQELDAALASEQLRHQADLDQLAQEKQLLEYAAAEVARFERLQQEQFYSQAAVDQSRSVLTRQQISVRSRQLAIADHKARMAQLKGRLAQAQANLAQAELVLQRSRIIAPFSGLVAEVTVAAGDQVNAGQVLVRLYPAAGLEVRAKLPAPLQDEFLAAFTQGQRPHATARVGGETLHFRLTRLAGAADARGLDAFFALDKPSAALRLGELVSLSVVRSPVDGVVAVPYSALFDGNRVYRIERGRLAALEVEVVGEASQPHLSSPRLLVRSPALKDSDYLLVTHLPHAISGLKVEIVGP